METYNKLNVFRYEDSEESVNEVKGPAIFLAGPTVRGNQPHLTSWRFEAIEIFKERGFEGSLIVPEFTSKTESDKGKKWIPLWEFNGLKRADCILFWIPRTKDEIVDGKIKSGLIALTTNWEHGYWMGREIDKVIYGRPDDAFRIGYLDTMWEAINNGNLEGQYKINNTLEDTIDAAILRTTLKNPMPRYFLDIRSGCGAVRDKWHKDYDVDYPGLHQDTPGVVKYIHGQVEAGSWAMRNEDLEDLADLCNALNGLK